MNVSGSCFPVSPKHNPTRHPGCLLAAHTVRDNPVYSNGPGGYEHFRNVSSRAGASEIYVCKLPYAGKYLLELQLPF